MVKVKVNTQRFNNSLEEAFKPLRELAEEHGAPQGIELLQARESDKVILFGWPGTRSRIELGQFPLPPAEPEPKPEVRETWDMIRYDTIHTTQNDIVYSI